ncbi:serine/threonine-protein kinase [Lentisphaera marina]|uniref:serine/threonine protein kinase n=1 Tax=Lentisphaera marina TaxID=1111041 RepID=UPI002365DA3F|nr:serine/threonine-protein kinase [Lentisphaera marina]MDD7985703.1 serine/threonine-protein kinase [Lentisphaera marina]
MKIKKKSYNRASPIEKAVGLFMPFHCDSCLHKLRVSQENYGYGMVCPYCKTGVICPAPSFHAGEQVGPYLIDGWLAKGAMGEVYYGHSLKTERVVALKILNTDIDSQYAFRLFEQEAYIMDHFEHECLPRLAGFNEHHNYYYLAMNYVEGEGLDTLLLRKVVLDQIYVLDLIIRLADLLDHVWRKFGAIHRDIKPANIMATEDDKIVLIDWGLAHIYNHPIENDTDITFGTPEYICPVIVSGESNPDYRTDIYSLGATCFHLVTGQFPFHSENAEEVIDLVLHGKVPCAHEVNKDVSPEFSKILAKMMQRDYDDRYQNWAHLVEDVEKLKMFLSFS